MRNGPLLMIPGPTPVDSRVLRALSQEPISFIGREFVQIYLETVASLKAVMQTEGDVVIMAGTGTLGLDLAVVNPLGPGDRALVVIHGKWGERLARIARCYRVEVKELVAEPGDVVSLASVERELDRERYRAVLVTHVETSTGVRAPVEEIGRLAHAHDCLYIVDGVSSTGALREPMDEWGIDVLITASQKALGCPPGLTMLGVGPRALRARRDRKSIPNHYADWLEYVRVLGNPTVETHVTHPVNMIYALHEGLRLVLQDGLGKRIAQHARWAGAIRAGMRALGFQPLARDEFASNTVTVGLYPPGVPDVPFRTALERQGVLVAPCGGTLASKGLRVGHMGSITDLDVISCVAAMERVLMEMGRSDVPGKGVAAAEKALAGE